MHYYQSAVALKGSESGKQGTNGGANRPDGQPQSPVAEEEKEEVIPERKDANQSKEGGKNG